MIRLSKYVLSLILLGSFAPLRAQEEVTETESNVTVLPPLFDYPTVPEEITEWQARNNWLVEHFWDNFDFKQKAVGHAQLVHAFRTFTVPIRFADAKVSLKSIDKLISKLKKQPGLLLQFTKVAEQECYDPKTSAVIIDQVYLPFLAAIHADKKLPAVRKARYEHQYQALNGCLVGDEMKSFDFVDRNGSPTKFNPVASKYTIIEFGDPDCSECIINKVRLETDELLQKMCSDGTAQVYFIIPDADPDDDSWRNRVADYPHYWTVGAAPSADEQIDLRYTPCIYVIGPDRKIISKNSTPDQIHAILAAE